MRAFNEISFLDFPKIFYKRIEDDISSKSKDYILQVDEEDYIKYLIDKYALEPLNILRETEHVGEPDKSKVRVNNRWGEEYWSDTFKCRGESSFSFIFGLPQDPDKEVQLEVIAFHYDKK
jgi:hypothetical protein